MCGHCWWVMVVAHSTGQLDHGDADPRACQAPAGVVYTETELPPKRKCPCFILPSFPRQQLSRKGQQHLTPRQAGGCVSSLGGCL